MRMHENYPGWKKGIYPTREDAQKGLEEDALFVAQTDEGIAGTFILRHEPEEGYVNGNWLTENDYSRIYVLCTFAVHPKYMGQGVGAKMLGFAERFAREEKCISIRLDVVKDNLPAEILYQKQGYQLRGTVSLGYEEYGLPWFHLYEKVLMREQIISACGNDCAICPRYNTGSYKKSERELSHTAELWFRIGYRDHVVTNEEISCTGCKKDNWCRYEVVKCVEEKQIENCGQCKLYPCDNIKTCFVVTKSFEPYCREVCSEEEYERMKKAFFEKEQNLRRYIK